MLLLQTLPVIRTSVLRTNHFTTESVSNEFLRMYQQQIYEVNDNVLVTSFLFEIAHFHKYLIQIMQRNTHFERMIISFDYVHSSGYRCCRVTKTMALFRLFVCRIDKCLSVKLRARHLTNNRIAIFAAHIILVTYFQ